MRKRLSAIRERLDPAEYGGAPLLGLDGVTIIAHGSSNPRAIRNAIRAAANEALVERVNAEIVEMLARHVSAMPDQVRGQGLPRVVGPDARAAASPSADGESASARQRKAAGPITPITTSCGDARRQV